MHGYLAISDWTEKLRGNKMACLDSYPESMRSHLATLPCPTFETTPFVDASPAGERQVAMISTAGLHRRGDRSFRNWCDIAVAKRDRTTVGVSGVDVDNLADSISSFYPLLLAKRPASSTGLLSI
jgi:hypothetical protein